MEPERYRELCAGPKAFSRGELEETLAALKAAGSSGQEAVLEALKSDPIEKPELHRGGKETDYFEVDVGAGDVTRILSSLGELEARSVDADGDTTPMASRYASLLDRWARYADSSRPGVRRGEPTRMQYFFATRWIDRLLFGVLPLSGVLATALFLRPSAGQLTDGRRLLLWVGALFLIYMLCLCLARIAAMLVLGPIVNERLRINGAPFRAGHRVRILMGPHRDRIVQVLEVEDSTNQVRVAPESGETAGATGAYSFLEIRRED